MKRMEYVQLGDLIAATKTNRCGDNDFPVLSITKNEGIILQSEKFKKRIASKDTADYIVVHRGQLVQGIHIDEANFGIQEVVDIGIVSPAYKIWDIKSNAIVPKYLEIILRSPRSIAYYASRFNGSIKRRERLSDKDFLQMKIPCPPVAEQIYAIEVLDKAAVLIEQRKQQLMELDNLIKARFVEMFGDVIHNNKSWKMHVFADIASSRLGKMLDAKQQTGKCSYPYLANFNVQWFRFNIENLNQMDFDEDDRAELELKDGDLLVCEGGEIGRCAVWHNEIQPCFFQKALHRVRCNRQIIHPDYLAWWFKYNCDHDGFAAIAGAKATIAHLPGVKLKQLQVAVPPLELQQQFASFVEQVDKSKVAEATHTLCTLFNIILNGGTRYDIRTNEF